jgi:hypothetical protein
MTNKRPLFYRREFYCVSLLLLAFTSPVRSLADSLTVNVANSSVNAGAGETVTFVGTVSNATGANLSASDLFFDFFGFDPNLIVNQLLGTSDFLIPDGTTTVTVDLFNVTLPNNLGGSVFPVNFVLQDAFGNSSAVGSVAVSPIAASEPSTESLIVCASIAGLCILFGRRSKATLA